MHLISKVLSRQADSDFGDRQASGMHIYAGIAVCLLGGQVQLNTYNSTTFYKFVCACDCNMAEMTVQLHDCYRLNSIGRVQRMYNFVQASVGAVNAANLLTLG